MGLHAAGRRQRRAADSTADVNVPGLRSSPSAPLLAGEFFDGERRFPYTVRVSARSRYMRLTIRPDTGLVAAVPLGYRATALQQFLHHHRRWIAREHDRLARLKAAIPTRWPYGTTLPYRGEEHAIVLEGGVRPATVVRTAVPSLIVRMPAPTLEGARRLLKRWYLAEASQRLTTRAAELARVLGVTVARIRVRDQRYRWGSCSVHGHLNFNYRLIMAPPAALEYVVIHELMHRRQMNHSKRFWALVAEHCPDYRRHLAWLKTDGAYLSL